MVNSKFHTRRRCKKNKTKQNTKRNRRDKTKKQKKKSKSSQHISKSSQHISKSSQHISKSSQHIRPRTPSVGREKGTVTQLLLLPSTFFHVWRVFASFVQISKDLANNKEIKLRDETIGKNNLSFKEFKETKEKQRATFIW